VKKLQKLDKEVQKKKSKTVKKTNGVLICREA